MIVQRRMVRVVRRNGLVEERLSHVVSLRSHEEQALQENEIWALFELVLLQ